MTNIKLRYMCDAETTILIKTIKYIMQRLIYIYMMVLLRYYNIVKIRNNREMHHGLKLSSQNGNRKHLPQPL